MNGREAFRVILRDYARLRGWSEARAWKELAIMSASLFVLFVEAVLLIVLVSP